MKWRSRVSQASRIGSGGPDLRISEWMCRLRKNRVVPNVATPACGRIRKRDPPHGSSNLLANARTPSLHLRSPNLENGRESGHAEVRVIFRQQHSLRSQILFNSHEFDPSELLWKMVRRGFETDFTFFHGQDTMWCRLEFRFWLPSVKA
jgi:hypothetical protein